MERGARHDGDVVRKALVEEVAVVGRLGLGLGAGAGVGAEVGEGVGVEVGFASRFRFRLGFGLGFGPGYLVEHVDAYRVDTHGGHERQVTVVDPLVLLDGQK